MDVKRRVLRGDQRRKSIKGRSLRPDQSLQKKIANGGKSLQADMTKSALGHKKTKKR